MPSILSSAATKCISDVPGLVKHTSTSLAISVRTRLSAPFMVKMTSSECRSVRSGGDHSAARCTGPASLRAPVEMRDGYGRQIDIFEAPHVDRRNAISFRVRSVGVWMHPARGAEAVFDHVIVELVGLRRILRRQQMHRVPRDEPQQRTFPLADRAVARHRAL